MPASRNPRRPKRRCWPRSRCCESAHLDLEFTEVRAPIDGRVSRALVTDGNYVSGVAGGATLLTTIVSVDPIYVYADMDENSLAEFNALAGERKAGERREARFPWSLQLADEEGFPHRGYIESFDNRLDPNTGSILLRAIFPNADGRIVPGLFARIRVPDERNGIRPCWWRSAPSAPIRRKSLCSR